MKAVVNWTPCKWRASVLQRGHQHSVVCRSNHRFLPPRPSVSLRWLNREVESFSTFQFVWPHDSLWPIEYGQSCMVGLAYSWIPWTWPCEQAFWVWTSLGGWAAHSPLTTMTLVSRQPSIRYVSEAAGQICMSPPTSHEQTSHPS